jgi:FAD/FMN-containing dehydrogenase
MTISAPSVVGLDLDPLRAGFAGPILTAADGDLYDAARVAYNAMFDRRPAVIAQAVSSADVAQAIGFARANGLAIAVRGGGHSVAGYSTIEGGLLLDLGPMKAIAVEVDARLVRVQPGVVWGELDAATQAHGLATTGGRMTTTGVAGFVLGSGSGWLERLHGLACDNLIAAELVTATGETITVNESENAELLWGLRGGGGNFGVVTEFTLRLHPVGPEVYAGMLMYPRAQAPEVVRHVRDFLRDAPREVTGGVIFMHAPPAPFVPPALQGAPVVSVVGGHWGSVDEGAEALAPLKEYGEPGVDLMGPTTYLDFQMITDAGNPPGRRNYWRSELLPDVPDEAIDALVACAAQAASPTSVVVLGRTGGAIGDVAEDATALSGRGSEWQFHCYASWTDADDTPNIAWARASEAALRPWTMAGMALNFVSDIDNSRVRSSFGAEKYQRLVQLKRQWDPENVFSMNQNIPPTDGTSRRAHLPGA